MRRPSDQCRPDFDLVAARAQLLHRRFRHAQLDHHHAGTRLSRPERGREMLGVPGRRVDRFLQVHARMHVAQEELRDPLILLVAAGRAPGEIRLAVAQRQVGVSVERGRLPGISAFGWLLVEPELCARVPRQKPSSGMTGDECSQPPDGVDDTMLPSRSTMSKCTVSPGTAPIFSRFSPARRPHPADRRRRASRDAADGRLARARIRDRGARGIGEAHPPWSCRSPRSCRDGFRARPGR